MKQDARYHALPFRAVRARHGNVVLTPFDGAPNCIVPEAAYALLDQLHTFRTLREHEEQIARRRGIARGHDPGIHTALEDLHRCRLLISEDDFLNAAGQGSAPATISTIAIPTRGESQLLDRCVGSFTAHARQYGHNVRFVIAGNDGGRRAAGLAEDLTRAGIDRDVARFALLGEAPGVPPDVARTTGAKRNMLLLECVGEAFLSVDDDTVCELFRPPSWHDGRMLHSSGTLNEMWFGPDLPEQEIAEGVDLLAELGRAFGPAMPSRWLKPCSISHSAMESMLRGTARTRIVQTGLRGDSATDTPTGWLTASGATRERLTASEAAYRQALTSRRAIAAVTRETVSESRQLMAYCIAMDNRTVLPPFPPLGRDQDGVFGSWVRLAEPDSFTVHLPLAIAHEPTEVRIFANELRPALGVGLNDVLRLLLDTQPNNDPAPVCLSAADRIRILGARLREMAALPGQDFKALLTARRLRYLSGTIAYFEAALAAFGSKPAWWARDMQSFIRSCEHRMGDSDSLRFAETGSKAAPTDPVAMYQSYAYWCGALLSEWPAMCAAVAELKQQRPNRNDAH